MNYETLLKHGAAFNTFEEIHNLIEIKSKREYFNFLQCDTKLLIKKLNKKKEKSTLLSEKQKITTMYTKVNRITILLLIISEKLNFKKKKLKNFKFKIIINIIK